jgi:16S rRNA (cytidine1402-2'-O)-methyltransferase
VRLLEQLAETFGPNRQISACREISKVHEESTRGTVAEVLEHFRTEEPRGEFVIIVGGDTDETDKVKESTESDTTEDSKAPLQQKKLSKYQQKQLNKGES